MPSVAPAKLHDLRPSPSFTKSPLHRAKGKPVGNAESAGETILETETFKSLLWMSCTEWSRSEKRRKQFLAKYITRNV